MNDPGTIRDEIQRRARPVRWIGIGITVAVVIFVVVLRNFRFLPRDVVPLVAFGFLALIVIARLANVGLRRRVMCPKCKGSLGYFTSAMQDSKQGKKISFCPHCAVNLDDPMPTPAEEITTPDKLVWK